MVMRLCALLLSLMFLGCQGGGKSDLQVSLRGNDMILIKSTGRSCKAQSDTTVPDDVQPIKIVLNSIEMDWKGLNELRLSHMQLRLEGAGLSSGVFLLTIGGADLGYIWKGLPQVPVYPGEAGPITTSANCVLEFGGISLLDESQPAYGGGSILVYGTTTEGGQAVPVQHRAYFSWSFDGIR